MRGEWQSGDRDHSPRRQCAADRDSCPDGAIPAPSSSAPIPSTRRVGMASETRKAATETPSASAMGTALPSLASAS